MRIAILEDDPDQLALLSRWIANAGHQVHGYLRGNEVLKNAARESFDLFALDWEVPDISGVEVCRQIRADPRTKGLRILMGPFTVYNKDNVEAAAK